MAEAHVTVKLSLSLLPGGRCRARIDESPAGASHGAGSDFDLPPAPADGYPKFLKQVGGGNRPISELETLGKGLFERVTNGCVGQTFAAARAVAQTSNAYLRIAISAVSPELVPIPWEYFHDGNGFLLQDPKIHIVRVLDELGGQMAPFRPFTRLLIVVANPANMARFDADDHLHKMQSLLQSMGLGATVVFPATREKLLTAIETETFDAFYFLGHGSFDAAFGGRIFLEDAAGDPDPFEAPLLANRLSKTKTPVYFAYFNSCDTADADGQNTFSGVAQKVIANGRIPAVLAQQAPVRAHDSMRMAEAFLRRVGDGESPEAAIAFARLEVSGHMWGVPVLYTHLRGPEEFERNRIECLLESDPKTRFVLFLPTFQMGIPKFHGIGVGEVRVTVNPPGAYHYKGDTHPLTAVRAAWDVTGLLAKIVPKSQIDIVSAGAETSGDATHQFHFGATQVATLLESIGAPFRFRFDDAEWVLTDEEYKREYSIKNLSKATHQEFAASFDYGVVVKVVEPKRVLFIIAGFGDRATRGSARYLADNWSSILKLHAQGNFNLLLELKPGRQYHEMAQVADRTNSGKPVR